MNASFGKVIERWWCVDLNEFAVVLTVKNLCPSSLCSTQSNRNDSEKCRDFLLLLSAYEDSFPAPVQLLIVCLSCYDISLLKMCFTHYIIKGKQFCFERLNMRVNRQGKMHIKYICNLNFLGCVFYTPVERRDALEWPCPSVRRSGRPSVRSRVLVNALS